MSRDLYAKFIDRSRCEELEAWLLRMQDRGLSDMHGAPYDDEADPALHRRVMYFQPLLLCPSDRREVARTIVGNSVIKPIDKLLNIMLTYMYGPTWIYLYVTGKTDPMEAHVDFERVYTDPAYMDEIRENVKYARLHGHSMWTTTELHTSLQTAARNYVRVRYNQPDRKADSLDLIEWLASFPHTGVTDKILAARSLEEGYDAITSVHGIGPYFGYNSIAMIANCDFVQFDHDGRFCAPGGGACKTLDYLFEPLKAAGHKLRYGDALVWMREEQHKLFPDLKVHPDFQNMEVAHGKLLKEDQTYYTANSFEVGCCQFSVYRKFVQEPAAIERRLNPPPIDLAPFQARERGEPSAPTSLNKSQAPAVQTKANLLAFD